MSLDLFQRRKSPHRTTILIDDVQWKFLKQTGYKPTQLLRKKINELMSKGAGVNFEGVALKMRVKLNKICKLMEENLSKEDFENILSKLD